MRKYMKIALVAASIIIVFIGGFFAGRWTAPTPVVKKRPFEGVTITFIAQDWPWMYRVEELTKIWEEETGADVIIHKLPYSGLYERLVMELTSRTGTYDLITMDVVWYQTFAKYLLDLGKYMEDPSIANTSRIARDDWIENIWKCHAFDLSFEEGRRIGVPFCPNSFLFTYRKDLFEEYDISIPEYVDWDWALEVAKKLTLDVDGDGKIDIYGHVLNGMRDDPIACEHYMRALDYGVPYRDPYHSAFFDENWVPTFNKTDAWKKALQFMVDVKPYAPPGIAGFHFSDTVRWLSEGKAATAEVITEVIAEIEDPTKSTAAGKFGYIPPKVANIHGWGLSACADSRNPEATYKYIEFLCSPEIRRELAKAGLTPIRKSVVNDSGLQELYPYLEMWLEATGGEWVGWSVVPEQPTLLEMHGKYPSAALIGEITVDEAIDSMQKECTEIMRKAGYYD